MMVRGQMDPRRGQGRCFELAAVIALNLKMLEEDYFFGRHVGMLNNMISLNGATAASGEQTKSR
jgi:hypothetical protein